MALAFFARSVDVISQFAPNAVGFLFVDVLIAFELSQKLTKKMLLQAKHQRQNQHKNPPSQPRRKQNQNGAQHRNPTKNQSIVLIKHTASLAVKPCLLTAALAAIAAYDNPNRAPFLSFRPNRLSPKCRATF